MSSNRIDCPFRVNAWPLHALFPQSKQPMFHISDLPYEKGGQNWGTQLWPSEGGYGTGAKGELLPDPLIGTMEPDTVSKCCYARPILVPHDNEITGNYTIFVDFNPNLPILNWTLNSMAQCFIYNKGTDARERYSSITAQGSMPSSPGPITGGQYDIQTTGTIKWQGFWCSIAQLPATGVYGPSQIISQVDLRGTTEVRFKIGSYADTHLNEIDTADFVIVLNPTGYPEIFRCWDVGWTGREKLQDLKPTGGLQTTNIGNTRRDFDPGYGGTPNDITSVQPTLFEVRLIGGVLQVRWDSGATPFSYVLCEYNTNQEEVAFIRQVRVVMDDIIMSQMSVHPMMFLKYATQKSQVFTLGFVPKTAPVAFIRDTIGIGGPFNGDPPTTTGIFGTIDYEGSQVRYKVEISNDSLGSIYNGIEYSTSTHAYRSVDIRWDEVFQTHNANPVQLFPEAIDVTHDFHSEDLSITAGGALTFNNFNTPLTVHPYTDLPNQWWGEWANGVGAIGITIDVNLKWYSQPGQGFDGSMGWKRIFTGIGNLKSTTTLEGQGKSKYVMRLYSRDVAMATQKWNLPWADGWNHYYFAAYMASQGGVMVGSLGNTNLAFLQYVPLDPFMPSPALPTGQPDYFLPMGTGGSPLMSFPGGQNPWEVLRKFALPRGFMRYFDVQGNFHYEKFAPYIPKTPYRWFQGRDSDATFTGQPPTVAIFTGHVERDLMQVRNDVTVIGVDAMGPLWNPIVAHRRDEASIDNFNANAMGPTAFNFLGFQMGFVDMDSIFANLAFASDACDGYYNFLRYPGLTPAFNTWIQPDIFPGMWIGVNEWKTGLGNLVMAIPLFVTGISHHLELNAPPTSQIKCRFVPNALP